MLFPDGVLLFPAAMAMLFAALNFTNRRIQ
jgi:hypothetical protein